MLCSTPDGTITAGLGVRSLVDDDAATEASWDRVFLWINDLIRMRWPRWAVRWLFLHILAIVERDLCKVFTSHHSPFFSSGHLVVIHDVIPFKQPLRYPAQTFYTRNFLGTVMESADGVVTISHTVKDALLELFPEVRRKLRVIPSYSFKLEAPGDRLKVETTTRETGRFLMVGMTRRHKNLDWGAAGVEAAAQTTTGLSLDAVGVWPEFWTDVRAAADAPDRRSQLNLHGYVNDAALDGFYRSSRALLYLSSDEGMGLPPLEALARGCPVICSDIPIFREVYGEAAFYVPLRDTEALAVLIARLAKGELNGEIEVKLAAGRRRIENYGAERLALRWRELLTDYALWRTPSVI